jgi:hypothetical protein
MALPTDPTVTTLKTEALKKVGVSSPSATELTRADSWLQELLNDIWTRQFKDGNTRLAALQTEAVQISTVGKNFIDLPEDFDEEISIVVLDGDNRGTARAGGATSITLASSETITAANALGKMIVITGGLGSTQYKRIIAYDATTKIATVDSAWTTNPDSTSTYLVISAKCRKLVEDSVTVLDENNIAASTGKPTYFAKFYRKMIFDRPFDLSTYGILTRYFMHINQVDLTEGSTTRITRIMRSWRSVLDAGLQWKTLADKDDSRQGQYYGIYNSLANGLLVKETPYGGEFEGFTL